MLEIRRWPIRDMLVAYLWRVRDDSARAYRFAQLMWQVRHVMGPPKGSKTATPPSAPDLLGKLRDL